MTLIEVLIYIVVLVLLATALVATALSLRTVFERSSSERRLADAAGLTFERMMRDVRDADSVNLLLSTLNATSSVLALDNGATTTIYELENNTLMLEVNGTSRGPITPDAVTVDSFTAYEYTGTDNVEAVRVVASFTLESRFASTSLTFSDSAVLRGSYEE